MRVLFMLVALAVVASAQTPPPEVTVAALGRGEVRLERGWRYHPGDDRSWKAPGLDDASWEELPDPSLSAGKIPTSGWSGLGWFRLRLTVDPGLANVPLGLGVWHRGASEVYLDGTLVGRYGRVDEPERAFNPNNLPLIVRFPSGGEHVLAVRYASRQTPDLAVGLGRWLLETERSAGIYATFALPNRSMREIAEGRTRAVAREYFQSALLLAFALIHLVLFAFYPRDRANLLYALLTLAGGATVLLSYHANEGALDAVETYAVGVSLYLSIGLLLVFMLAFLSEAFWPSMRWLVWMFLAAWIALAGCYAVPALAAAAVGAQWPLTWLTLISSFVVLGRALVRKQDGARIVGLGVLAIGLIFVRNYVQRFLPLPGDMSFLIGTVGLTGFLLAGSAFLAKRFARTSRALEAQLANVRELSEKALEQERRETELTLLREQERARLALVEAENARRAKELDEARDLQLSMLPRTLPDLARVEVAAYMKPATEVGGDYYDFHVGSDGVLTIAVGDATGHGLKAGTVVSATKSLFKALAAEPQIPAFLRASSAAIKAMGLPQMYMAMMVAKLEGDRLRVSAAGMPPLLILRAETGDVEEVKIPGMPLGAVPSFPYKEQEVELRPGDTIVMLSDGLPERFGPTGEMFDDERVRGVLADSRGLSPQEIVDALARAGDAWGGSRPQDDDVTFVVLRLKDNERPSGVASDLPVT
jgi:serine phosphatase RsbU (regulator of sigma subunit)